jgi:hypothetical protein
MQTMTDIRLTANDPTIFACCPHCNVRGLGVPLGDINCRAYTKREWRQSHECENCKGQMVLLYELKVEDD